MANRLRLNFQLDTAEERTEFLQSYLQSNQFQKKPLTEEELEMCGNYILWGKDPEGKNSVQRKEVQIKTRNGTWDAQEDESLDALIESPTITESQLFANATTHYRKVREVFSREEALAQAPQSLIPIFQNLFRQIDTLDLLLNYYDLAHNKRKKPPRAELVNLFTETEQKSLQEQSTHLNQFKYLKLRHLLVELRRQQYALRDSYSTTIQRHTPPLPQLDLNYPTFDTDINIYPLGLFNPEDRAQLNIFQINLDPARLTPTELEEISTILWNKRAQFLNNKQNKKPLIDFRDLEHVHNLFTLYYDLKDSTIEPSLEEQTPNLLCTLNFYTNLVPLSETQKEILELKKRGKKNQEVATYINQKYNKSYSANYISTIFRQKIIKQINEAARLHETIIENIFFPENFKQCDTCGNFYLLDSWNFVKKSRSKDGFSNRCRNCDRAARKR